MFSWQGKQFEFRPNQSGKIVYRRKKRELHTEENQQSIRRDEMDLGSFIFAENITIINKYLIGTPRFPFAHPRRIIVIAVMNRLEKEFENISNKTMTKLWYDYGIANAILITPCNDDRDVSSFKMFNINFIFLMCFSIVR